MNVDRLMKTVATFDREKTVIFRLPGGEIYRVHGDRCGVNTQGEPIFHLEKIEDRMNDEIRRRLLYDYRPIVPLPDEEIEPSDLTKAKDTEEKSDKVVGMTVYEQVGIIPHRFADDETFKAYHTGEFPEDTCPECESGKVAKIEYGCVVTKEMEQKAASGEIIIGGMPRSLNRGEVRPTHGCVACGHRWKKVKLNQTKAEFITTPTEESLLPDYSEEAAEERRSLGNFPNQPQPQHPRPMKMEELKSTPNKTPNPFFMAECDHPNMECSRDGEFNKEECPDCGFSREWEDD